MNQDNLFDNQHYDFNSVFESDEELSTINPIEQAPVQQRMIDVNEVVENLIRLDEIENQKKKAAKSNDDDDDEPVTEVTSHQVGLIVGLVAFLAILCLVIFVLPRYSTSLLVSQAEQIQEQVYASMQTTRSIEAAGSDFQINFDYDEDNLISKITTSEFNGNTKTTYTTGEGDQFDSVLIFDVSTDYNEVAYISLNVEKAASYTVSAMSGEVSKYTLDSSSGFVIFVDRFSKVTFFDSSGNELY